MRVAIELSVRRGLTLHLILNDFCSDCFPNRFLGGMSARHAMTPFDLTVGNYVEIQMLSSRRVCVSVCLCVNKEGKKHKLCHIADRESLSIGD